jgi:tryptophan synthase alpha chain
MTHGGVSSGVNRIQAIFSQLRTARRGGVMPFICGGHPQPGDTARLLPVLERAGACVAEIGFPFSDPIADGPVIAAAMHESLGRGATPASVFAEIARARAGGLSMGVVGMISVSIAWRLTPAKLVEHALASGVDGFIFPDLPLEEGRDLIARVKDAGLMVSLLVSPTTPAARAEEIAAACSGFVYMLARAGITGESGAPPEIESRVAELRRATTLPIACGFGISSAEHVRAVVKHADAAIVGSALVRRLTDAGARGESVEQAAEAFVNGLAVGLA